MSKSRKVHHLLRCATAVLFVLSVALSIVAVRMSNARQDWIVRASNRLMAYEISQQSLQLDLLNARAGLLRNYDPVNANVTAMREHLQALGRLPMSPRAGQLLRGLMERSAEQEALVEQFKSANALLQNALSRFAANGDQETPARRVLSAQILRLTLDTSQHTVAAAQRAVERLPNARAGTADAQMVAHARLLVRVLPEIDDMLHRFRALQARSRIDALEAAVRTDAVRRATLVRRMNVSAVIAIALLAIAVAMLLFLHQLRTRELRAQAANARLSAAIAMPLIDSADGNFLSRVRDAVHRLALHIGARRIQLLVPGTSDRALLSWPGEKQPDWLSALIRAAATDRAWRGDQLIVTSASRGQHPALDAAMRDQDMEDLVLLRTAAPHRVVIGFEPRRLASAERRDYLAGVSSAIIAIAHGARREVLQKERQRLERTLARARRMETIGAMASGVAHNFNNIVGAISGFAEIGQERIGENRAARHALDEIQEAVIRAQQLVDDILSFAKQGRAPKASVDLDKIVRYSIRLVSAAWRDDQAIGYRAADAPCTVLGAEAELQQVVLNICNNGRQASGGGRVCIRVRSAELAEVEHLSHGALDPGRYVVVSICDAGPGIAAHTLPRLFEPFFTTKAGGTGLGLSTAWEIVQDDGGTIDVANRESGGARFSVWLPAIEREKPPTPRGAGAGVLVLSDEDGLRALEDLIASLGYEPGGMGLATPVAALQGLLERCDVVLVVSEHRDRAAEAMRTIAPVLRGRPILFAVPEGAQHGATALRYPLDPAELAAALADLTLGRP